MRVIIHHARGVGSYLYQRTKRFLSQQEIYAGRAVATVELTSALRSVTAPTYLAQGGVWPLAKLPTEVPSSATGKALMAYGIGEDSSLGIIYLEPAAAHELGALLQKHTLEEAIHLLTATRVVHLPELNYGYDAALRVLQVVTTIQVGGAERVTLDLAQGLSVTGHKVWVAALYKPNRSTFNKPANFIDLSRVRNLPDQRAKAIQEVVHLYKLDIIHGHLLKGSECEAICALDLPLVVTLHNMPKAWPKGLAGHGKKADLFIACSREVEKAIRRSPLGRCRTAWNGIDQKEYAPTAQTKLEAMEWRKERGWENDLIVISVANPRLQKRLERVAPILKQLQKLVSAQVRFILVGEAVGSEAEGCLASLKEACEQYHIPFTQFSGKPNVYLHAADIFLSTSDYEGLSLSQLEALAAGVPVVATRVGAADEITREVGNREVYATLSRKCTPAAFAKVMAQIVRPFGVCRRCLLPPAFFRDRMCRRVSNLYLNTLAVREMQHTKPDGIWLVTNNFSMGGAQSSARRFLGDLKARGIKAQAFTVQEHTPTQGTHHLQAQGIPVETLAELNSDKAAHVLLNKATVQPPQCIIFWNLITSYKLAIADGFSGTKTRVVDVSPGEMFFKSLEEYFKQPQSHLPCRTGREYGQLLSGMVVKFSNEVPIAEKALGCKVSVVRNGMPLNPREEPHNNLLMFGTAARISPDKRLEDLIAAFHIAAPKLPTFELHIAGKIERGAEAYYASLQAQAKGLPVVWRGELPGTKDYLKELDIFVMISEPAGCPNASLESLATGIPTIVTDVGGAAEQVVHRVNGLITPRKDNQALANAIVELASCTEMQEQFRQEGPNHIAEHFSMQAMLEGYLNVCLPKRQRLQFVKT